MNESNNEVMFTSAAVLDLLLQIDELSDYTIGISDSPDGNIRLQVGNSIYMIDGSNSKLINVDQGVVDEIGSTAEDAYQDILEDTEDITSEVSQYDEDMDFMIQGSIIKEIAKALTLGGLIRFATKHLLK